MAALCHMGAAVLKHVALSGRLDAVLDERSLRSRFFVRFRTQLHVAEMSYELATKVLEEAASFHSTGRALVNPSFI